MQLLQDYKTENVQTVKIELCKSKDQLDAAFDGISRAGGEGIMIRADVAYKAGRSTDLLKYKKFETIDAKVIGYKQGTGRYSNACGSVHMETLDTNKTFYCVPPDQFNPPSIGTIAEIKCMELTKHGLPRHPVWNRIRNDLM